MKTEDKPNHLVLNKEVENCSSLFRRLVIRDLKKNISL